MGAETEGPTLKNIARELTTPGYWGRARERKKAKTGWDIVFLPIGFAAIGGFWYAQSKAFLWLHLLLYPADLGHLKTLTGGRLTVGQALIFLVPLFSAVPVGFLTSNALMWLVPPARRASERKAKCVKWANFREAQLGLLKIAMVLVPIGLIAGIAGALVLGR